MKIKVLFPEMTLSPTDRRKRYRHMAATDTGSNSPTKRQIKRLPERPSKAGRRKQRRAIGRIMRAQGLSADYFVVER